MNIATGGGTLVHEIVHPCMRADSPDCPPWSNEGMGSLYEQSMEKVGGIRGLTNWRLPRLQQGIKAGTDIRDGALPRKIRTINSPAMSRAALAVLTSLFGVTATPLVGAEIDPETRIINRYLQAHSTRDLEGMFSLFAERPGAEMEKRLRVVLVHSFGAPIKKIELVPQKPAADAPAPKPPAAFKVTHNLVAHFPDDKIGYSLISFPLGWKDGRLCLAPVPDRAEK